MDSSYRANRESNITFTSTGHPVMPEAVDDRLTRIDFLRDYRLEQTANDSYRIQALPEPDRDFWCLRSALLDALVDVYGMQGNFDIDVILEDDELMPKVPDRLKRIRRAVG